MSYTLHREAEVDLFDAVRFYRREAGRAVANRFLDEFERVAELLVSNPNLGTATGDQRHAFPLHSFPYSIIYITAEGGVRILVVRHQHRDPEYGERRR